jgi:hypothetical protein
MERDFENIHDIDNLDDQELKDLIVQELGEYGDIDPDLVEVRVVEGQVTLGGRVGTEQEWQEIEHVVTDLIGVERYTNEIVVDELMRAEQPEAADDAVAEEREAQPILGKRPVITEDSASHLVEDLESEMYGTQDVQQAIEEGRSYEPPEGPVQEGTFSRENH